MDNALVSSGPCIRALYIHLIAVAVYRIPGLISSDMSPCSCRVQFAVRIFVRDSGLAGQQVINLFFRHLNDRQIGIFYRNSVEEKLFFFLLKLFLFKSRTGIKDLIEINIGRFLIGGMQKAVTASLIEIVLQGSQLVRIHLFQLFLPDH